MSNENKQNAERAAFEAYWLRDVPEAHRPFAKKLLDGYDPDYKAAAGVADAWKTWQAARATQQATTGDERAEFDGMTGIDAAKRLIVRRVREEVGNDTFSAYIREVLAGDFAIEVAKLVQGSQFECAARKQGTAGGNDPADCDWPHCGCDEHANRVIGAIAESTPTTPSPVAGSAGQAPITDEQRQALQWAADRAHVESLGKSIGGVEGRRWRILLDLIRNSAAAPTAPSLTQGSAGQVPDSTKAMEAEAQRQFSHLDKWDGVLGDNTRNLDEFINPTTIAEALGAQLEGAYKQTITPSLARGSVAKAPNRQEPYAYAYEWDTPFGLHRDLQYGTYNGAYPNRTIALYTETPTAPSLATDAEAVDQRHVGDSNFEGWYQEYATRLTGNPKQTARDAYAAGMGDASCGGNHEQ